MKSKLNIGLFGYGCVGSGIFEVLQNLPELPLSIQKICIKNDKKTRNIPSHYFTENKHHILHNPNIHIVVELISDANEAFQIVSEALRLKKPVITANKKMLAHHFEELIQLSKENQTPLLYEAAVAGSIPIIRLMEDHFKNHQINGIDGILNGTTNYILSNMQENETSFSEALFKAQTLGFAEQNASSDIQGFDSKYKLSILIAHAMGLFIEPEAIFNFGIQNLNTMDSKFAKEKNYTLKLNAYASLKNNKISAYVMPKFMDQNEAFCEVKNEFNAVQVSATLSDKQLYTGKGAGSYPTASAVLSDLTALHQGYQYAYHKRHAAQNLQLDNQVVLTIYLRYSNKEVLNSLHFLSVHSHYQSNDYKYIIGNISLAQLIQFNPNNHAGVFLAEMPTNKELQQPIVLQTMEEQLLHELCV